MSTCEFIKVVLYAHWASALINNDYSGLEELEPEQIDAYVEQQRREYEMFYCVDAGEEYFGHPDIPGALPGTVLEYTFQIR